MKKIDTIYIVGPTASGKTALSIRAAKAIGAEIVCADSQTLRRGMDIGTAKPTHQEMDGVPHHMIDIIDPYDNYSLYQFKNTASKIIYDIHKRNKPVIVVGGTGLYIDSLYYDYVLPEIYDSAHTENYQSMTVDQLQAEIINRNLQLPTNHKNKRHLVNVLTRKGNGGKGTPSPSSIIVGIAPDREALEDRIRARVDAMFENGFVDEVSSIVEFYGEPPKLFDGIGYRIIYRMLQGEIDEAQSRELFKVADRQYARRQMSWFRRNPDIAWFDSPELAETYILEKV